MFYQTSSFVANGWVTIIFVASKRSLCRLFQDWKSTSKVWWSFWFRAPGKLWNPSSSSPSPRQLVFLASTFLSKMTSCRWPQPSHLSIASSWKCENVFAPVLSIQSLGLVSIHKGILTFRWNHLWRQERLQLRIKMWWAVVGHSLHGNTLHDWMCFAPPAQPDPFRCRVWRRASVF